MRFSCYLVELRAKLLENGSSQAFERTLRIRLLYQFDNDINGVALEY
jgi:hypothetical protein